VGASKPAQPARSEPGSPEGSGRRILAAQASEVQQLASPGACEEVALGQVVGAHGLRGELRVRTASGDALRSGLRVRLLREDGGLALEAEILGARPGREGELRLQLAGIEDRDGAEALRGTTLRALAGDLPKLPPGEYYQHELVGCRVEDAQGRALGRVRAIWQTGAPDVLLIEQDSGRELLVPAAESLLREVDVARRRLVIELPPGLLDEA
jgi:16S rRNA processing protein RimM